MLKQSLLFQLLVPADVVAAAAEKEDGDGADDNDEADGDDLAIYIAGRREITPFTPN